MSSLLLKSEDLIKVHSYMTHAGLAPGVVEIKPGQIIGIEPGKYLNNYRPSNVVSAAGDVTEIKEGSVLIFPSSLYHHVNPCKVPGRITISYNMKCCYPST